MEPARHDLTSYQGTTFQQTFYYKDAEGSAISLVGATARMQLRSNYADATVQHELTTENGGIQLEATPGQIDLTISAVDSAAIPAGEVSEFDPPFTEYVYDLEIVYSSGHVDRLLFGRFRQVAEVTR